MANNVFKTIRNEGCVHKVDTRAPRVEKPIDELERRRIDTCLNCTREKCRGNCEIIRGVK